MSGPKIFISYAHQDRDAASAIASALKNANLDLSRDGTARQG